MIPAQAAVVIAALVVVLTLAVGCSPLPDMPTVAQSGRPAPELLPLDALLAGVAPPRATQAAALDLSQRAARLRARANLMRGPVLAPATRQKLSEAIARGRA